MTTMTIPEMIAERNKLLDKISDAEKKVIGDQMTEIEYAKIDNCEFYNNGFCIQYIGECEHRTEEQRCTLYLKSPTPL